MKTLLATLFLLVLPVCAECQTGAGTYEDYKATVLIIRRDVVDLTASQDLLSTTNFVRLYENAPKYLSHALLFLGDQTNSEMNKMIVVYSLQKLPLKEYLDFENRLLGLANDSKISPAFFNKAIFPGLDWNTQIQCEYDKPDVMRLLNSLESSTVANKENKDYVKAIISGSERQNVRDMVEAGVLPKCPCGE